MPRERGSRRREVYRLQLESIHFRLISVAEARVVMMARSSVFALAEGEGEVAQEAPRSGFRVDFVAGVEEALRPET